MSGPGGASPSGKKPPVVPPEDAVDLLPPGARGVTPPPAAAPPPTAMHIVPSPTEPPIMPPVATPPVPPPLARGSGTDGAEQTIDYVRPPPPPGARPKANALLPPGAEETYAPEPAPLMPSAGPASPAPLPFTPPVAPAAASQATWSPPAAAVERSIPIGTPIVGNPVKTDAQKQTQEEAEQQRFWKNAIVFGVLVVLLLALCYFMGR